MASKRQTPLPRSPARKRTPRSNPVSPRPKGEAERLAVRRRDAMKYRLAGASYRAIAEKLTEERAQAYADEHGVSFERAMKKIPHVSKRTAWDDVTAELEDLQERTVRRECSFGNHGSALAWGRAQAARMPRRARPLGRALWGGRAPSWPATNAAPVAAQRLGLDFPQKPVIPGSFARPNTSPPKPRSSTKHVTYVPSTGSALAV